MLVKKMLSYVKTRNIHQLHGNLLSQHVVVPDRRALELNEGIYNSGSFIVLSLIYVFFFNSVMGLAISLSAIFIFRLVIFRKFERLGENTPVI